jgi:hypothetical protein
MRYYAMLLLLCLPVMAAEKAAYDSNGRIVAMLSQAEDVGVATSFVAVLPNGKRVPLRGGRGGGADGPGVRRQGDALAWSSPFTLPDGGRGHMEWKSEESAAGVRYSATITADSALDVEALEFVTDLPHDNFVNGKMAAANAAPVSLSAVRTAGPVLYHGEPASLHFADATGNLALDMTFDKPHAVSLVDRWDDRGRTFQLRAVILRGPVENGVLAAFSATLSLANHPPAPPPVRLTLDTAKARFSFDGFGGNYCWNNQSPVARYTLENLKLGWARSEMKVIQWDKQRPNPGPELRADLETMGRFTKQGVPFVISIWWLPERFYTDPYEKPRSAHFRLIKPERWDELLDLLGSYLLYAKNEFGAEPSLFSFNEANIGIYVGLTPETHTEAIKRIGAHFRKLGLKTRMLLGDATGPKDTHKFVLEAAADPEALQYVGAVAFHSWGGGTPEQYSAWGDVAEWLHLPLLVTELGVDAAAYNTRSWDSYHYGLQEAQMTQELLLYARPQGTQFWQFTNDYALARGGREGPVEPSARFWLMKHFTDLTPQHSEGLATKSDQKGVLFTAFRKDGAYTLHVLNLGPARTAKLEGLPDGDYRLVETTEAAQFQKKAAGPASAGSLQVELPSRSLVSLTKTR